MLMVAEDGLLFTIARPLFNERGELRQKAWTSVLFPFPYTLSSQSLQVFKQTAFSGT